MAGALHDVDRARSALQHLDSGCPRELWVKSAIAAKAAGLAFDDFHGWSIPAGNYKGERDCENVWKSISADGPTTAATLFSMAHSAGWQDGFKARQASNECRVNSATSVPRKAPVTPVKQAESAKTADVWSRCETATNLHGYITRKSGNAHGLRIYPATAAPLIIRGQNVAGFLVVPCYELDGNLQTLQFIPERGDKLNLPGASFGKGFFAVGDLAESHSIFIAEGLGQAWAAWQASGYAAVVCFGAGRMATVATVLRERFPTVRLVVLPDRGKESQAEAIARSINGEWVALPADKPNNFDASDFMQEAGVEALADLLEQSQAPAKPEPRFKLLSGADLSNAPPMRWMVRGVLPVEGLAALYGPSGSGKSFLVLDIAAAVAGGDYAWFGRRVKQGPVIYCALEGEAGTGKRVSAWSLHHKKPVPSSLHFVTQPFNLLNNADVSELSHAVQIAGASGGLVILDTLNRSAPGADENSSVDMGNIIAAAKRLQTLTGGLVLLVHHTGKDTAKGLRGHSSLYAALDGAIEVTRTERQREWSVAKSKDDETGTVHPFKLEIVSIGLDAEGDEITSCVATPDDSVDTVKRVKLPSGGNQKIALDALAEPLRKSTDFGKDGAPPGHPCIRLDDAVVLVAERLTVDPKRRTERATQALTALVARGIYGVLGDWLWRV